MDVLSLSHPPPLPRRMQQSVLLCNCPLNHLDTAPLRSRTLAHLQMHLYDPRQRQPCDLPRTNTQMRVWLTTHFAACFTDYSKMMEVCTGHTQCAQTCRTTLTLHHPDGGRLRPQHFREHQDHAGQHAAWPRAPCAHCSRCPAPDRRCAMIASRRTTRSAAGTSSRLCPVG